MREGCCNAGFRHEVMPLPFELQMLEVRPTRPGSLLGTQTCEETSLVPPACHILARLRCVAEGRGRHSMRADLTPTGPRGPTRTVGMLAFCEGSCC